MRITGGMHKVELRQPRYTDDIKSSELRVILRTL